MKIYNKSNKPDNIIQKEVAMDRQARELEQVLPSFLRDYFLFLKNSHQVSSRVEYLRDLRFFLTYILKETDFVKVEKTPEEIDTIDLKVLTIETFRKIKGMDINIFLDYARQYNMDKNGTIYIFQNSNRSLARKRSSIIVCFKYLFRNGYIEKDISAELDPIKLPKAGDREIKTLEDNEVLLMLDIAKTGEGLSKKEKQFHKKNKDRDYLILLLFVTYGLRISELQQLNISSFNFSRLEFKIYRKRGKEAIMPISKTVEKALHTYIDKGRQDILKGKLNSQEDALFISLQGQRLTVRQIRDTVKKYTSIALQTTRNAGYSPHKLRATVATSLIEKGHSIYDVQELLSHDSIATTQLYAAHRKGIKRELVKDLEWE
jgi:site-specific recombinase XerD